MEEKNQTSYQNYIDLLHNDFDFYIIESISFRGSRTKNLLCSLVVQRQRSSQLDSVF